MSSSYAKRMRTPSNILQNTRVKTKVLHFIKHEFVIIKELFLSVGFPDRRTTSKRERSEI